MTAAAVASELVAHAKLCAEGEARRLSTVSNVVANVRAVSKPRLVASRPPASADPAG